jgi:ferredoxin
MTDHRAAWDATPADEAAVVIPGEEITTILAALNDASDYNRDWAAACGDESCGTCQTRLKVAEISDHLLTELLQTAEASRTAVGNQPEPASTRETRPPPQVQADKEAGE